MADDVKLHEDKQYMFKPFRVPKYQIQFKNATSLGNIQGYTWYSPAALYLWGRFTEKNLSDLVEKYNLTIFWYRFDKPIFKGFDFKDDRSWNQLLWASKHEDFPRLVDGILETVQFDLDKSVLYQYALQKLTVYDPLNVDLERFVSPNTPTLDINVFAVLSNLRQCAFDTKQGLQSVPGMVSYPPDELHVKAANKLFSLSHKDSDAAFQSYKKVMIEIQDEMHLKDVAKRRRAK